MPRAWTDQEKSLIKEELLKQSERLFEKFGLQKTTLDDIVRAVGISKGAFYLFYQSKEELFFDLLERLEKTIKQRLFSYVWDTTASSRTNLMRFFLEIRNIFHAIPLAGKMKTAEFTALQMFLPAEKLAEHNRHDQDDMEKLFNSWADRGWVRRLDWKALNSVVQTFIMVMMKQNDTSTNPQEHEAEVQMWLDMLCRLIQPSEKEK